MSSGNSKAPGYKLTTTCSECPWRTDVEPGRFPPERFDALRNTVEQHKRGWESNPFKQPVFACHKTSGPDTQTCVGFLLVEGDSSNLAVRLAVMDGRVDLGALSTRAPLFGSFREMAIANGVDPARFDEED